MAREFGNDPQDKAVPSTEEAASQTISGARAALAELSTRVGHAQRVYGIGSFPAYGSFYRMHYSDGYFVGENLVMVETYQGNTYEGKTTPASQTPNGPKYDLQLTIATPDKQGEFQTPFGDRVTPSFTFGVNKDGVFVAQYAMNDGKLVVGSELFLPEITAGVIQDLSERMQTAARTRPQVDMQRKSV